jgi:hypothetical protein
LTLAEAVDLTRTGDLWLFRGHTPADRAIQVTTNSPVNHVGMAVVIEDLPPLMWHAELGRSLPDLWSGTHQRGVQLHDLASAVGVWSSRYGQRAWLRQLQVELTPQLEDAVLRTIARMDGTPFPSTARLAGRWLRGRVPTIRGDARAPGLETAYCAEVVAVTYEAMGLLPTGRRPNWYDPGRFWSGDELPLPGCPARRRDPGDRPVLTGRSSGGEQQAGGLHPALLAVAVDGDLERGRAGVAVQHGHPGVLRVVVRDAGQVPAVVGRVERGEGAAGHRRERRGLGGRRQQCAGSGGHGGDGGQSGNRPHAHSS